MLVDSHCHLNFPELKADLDAVVSRARAAGVSCMQTICTDMAEFDEIHDIATAYDDIFCSVGVHPNDSGKTTIVDVEALTGKCALDKVIGIGETGLDYHYETSDRATQKESFSRHIQAAQLTKLPIIVHSRDAEEDTAAMLHEAFQRDSFTGVIHCFTSTQYLADKALELGFYISFSGIVTFKNAQSIRDVLKNVPLDRVLIETDAPYLAPVPMRGKSNEPSYVAHTHAYMANFLGIDPDELAKQTTDNFYRLFPKALR